MYTARLQSTAEDSQDGSHKETHASAIFVCDGYGHQGSNQPTSLEDTIYSSFQLSSIRTVIQTKVCDEGRLNKRCTNDTGRVRVRQRAQGDEEDSLEGIFVSEGLNHHRGFPSPNLLCGTWDLVQNLPLCRVLQGEG